jgi:hypothetical protein
MFKVDNSRSRVFKLSIAIGCLVLALAIAMGIQSLTSSKASGSGQVGSTGIAYVPSFLGESLSAAQSQVSGTFASDFSGATASVTVRYNSDPNFAPQEGEVIAQVPISGTTLTPSTPITLIVAGSTP